MAFGFHGISVLRVNRGLLKKRKFKDIKQLLIEKCNKTEVKFKEISPKKLAQIKTEIRSKAKENAKRELFIYGFLALLLLLGMVYFTVILFN